MKKAENRTRRRILLDRDQSNLLINSANLVSTENALDFALENALLALVLFEEAEIAIENCVLQERAVERLYSEGLARPIPREVYKEPSLLVKSYLDNLGGGGGTEGNFTSRAQEKSIQAIWPMIAGGDSILSPMHVENAVMLLRAWGGEFPHDSDYFDLNFGDLRELHELQNSHGLPSPQDYEFPAHHIKDLQEKLRIQGLENENEIADYIGGFSVANRFAPRILARYVEMRGLTQRALATGFPILTDFGGQKCKLDRSMGEDAFQLFRIHLDEVKCVPYLRSIDDVLRLRGHKYITHFQEAIFEWLTRMTAGEVNVEAKYRAQIRLANEELKKLGAWKALDSPYTLAASVTVGVAEIFTGTFFGFGFAAASATAMLQKKSLTEKYGYALFRP
ncbi:hypothetical protein [Ruegeria sp. HKCCA5463]|uniref:hypothetical protein n=1 Tax=Ruegeria sp. HKCCA5463 TaxID=2682994 RepID=UPI001489FDF1|nr:hypothetical protein [Ruegeria sp. HKCCA5463]